MTNEAVSEKDVAFQKYIRTPGVSTPRYDFEAGWDACAKRSIDKEKLISYCKKSRNSSFASVLIDRINGGEFDLE